MKKEIKVGAGAIIIKGKKTLLTLRKNSHGHGEYGSIGGHVEYGEHPTEALKREAKEELNIELHKFKFLHCLSMVKYGKQYIDVTFTAQIKSGIPKISEPDFIADVSWYPIASLPSPLFEPVRIAFEALKKKKNYFEVKDF